MDPKVWGKAWWQMLFSSALGYNLEPSIDDQYAYSRFYMLLSQVLPCETCKINFESHFRNVPINFYLHSRKALLDWVLILHNEVNKTLGKGPLTLKEAIIKYLGQGTLRTSTYRQCVEGATSMADLPNQCGNNDWVPQQIRSRCPATASIDVVEGFNLSNMEYKDYMILILVGIVVYYAFFKRK